MTLAIETYTLSWGHYDQQTVILNLRISYSKSTFNPFKVPVQLVDLASVLPRGRLRRGLLRRGARGLRRHQGS